MQEHQPAAHVCFGRNPALAWSTPWTIFDGRLVFAASPAPAASVSILNTTSHAGLADPFVSGMVAWDLGHDWGFSYMLGAYIENQQSGGLQFKLAQSAFRPDMIFGKDNVQKRSPAGANPTGLPLA